MEYASIIRDPHFIKDSDALETVQRRAARWITSKHDRGTSVTALLHQLHLEPLEERRRISRLTFLYKILNDHVVVPMNQLDLVLCDRPVRGSTTKQRLKIPHCASTQFQNSFAARTITEWNKQKYQIGETGKAAMKKLEYIRFVNASETGFGFGGFSAFDLRT